MIATIDAPSGIMTLLTRRMAEIGMTSTQLYAATGLTVTDWNALNTALGGANGAAFLKFANAVGLVFGAQEMRGVAPTRDPAAGNVGSAASLALVARSTAAIHGSRLGALT